MSDLVINVKQISNYPARTQSDGSETLLLQVGGLGGPYQSISAQDLVASALANGPTLVLGGTPVALNALLGDLGLANGAAIAWDSTAGFSYQPGIGFLWNIGDSFSMTLNDAGALSLPFGTITVARDPAAAFEVVTLNYLANNTVASFNNRKGAVTLTASDVYQALGLCDPIATQPWVINAVNAGIQSLLTTCPFVNRWNGRTGSVYMTLSDITTVFFQPGQQPISPTPVITSNDNSIATTAWVTEYIANEFAGSGGNLATQTWVLANTVNSFNGRRGPVTLTLADVVDVGAAPLNGPNFSGIPTAPTAAQGQATGQIATTAFVQQAIAHNTAGVSTFNTRAGDVVLDNADIVAAGGITNPSANLTGSPTAPTAAPGTSSPQIANTQFVAQAILAGTVQTFNNRNGAVTLISTDILGAGGALLASPTFTGTPAAPTAAPGTATTQLATTQFVTAALTAAGGVSSFNGRTGAVDLLGNDISAAGGLVNPSVNLTGIPTAPTAATNTNTSQIATTQFVQAALASTVTSFNARSGAVLLQAADITGAGGALLASPAFSGAPTAPTATAGTNNTQLATTAFVAAAIAADTTGVTSFNTRVGAVTLLTADITQAGGAPSVSPAFTGIPVAPTAVPGTSTTQIATTQFVQSAIASSGVASFNGRTGAVTLIANDVSAAGGALLASPSFTGTPAGPTATAGTNSTQLATTAYVMAAVAQPATVAPLMNAATAAVGTSLLYARQDHVHPRDSGVLPLTGGTLSGTLNGTAIVASGVITAQGFAAQGPAGTSHQIQGVSGTTTRWNLQLGDGSAEGGANNGSNFALSGWTDAGTFLSNWLTINRASGQAQFPGGSVAVLSGGNAEFVYCNASGVRLGVMYYYAGGGAIRMQQVSSAGYAQIDGGGNFVISGAPFCPGGGSWRDSSDIRVKDVIGEYHAGLDAILALRPTLYRYKGNDTPTAELTDPQDAQARITGAPYPASSHYQVAKGGTVFVGLVAQEVIDVLPGLVSRQHRFIDGEEVDDLLSIDPGELTYTLINAVKELAGANAILRERIEAAEARLNGLGG